MNNTFPALLSIIAENPSAVQVIIAVAVILFLSALFSDHQYEKRDNDTLYRRRSTLEIFWRFILILIIISILGAMCMAIKNM